MSSAGWISRLVAPGATTIAGLATTAAVVGGGTMELAVECGKKWGKILKYLSYYFLSSIIFKKLWWTQKNWN